jgi:hypothetical protein
MIQYPVGAVHRTLMSPNVYTGACIKTNRERLGLGLSNEKIGNQPRSALLHIKNYDTP